MSKKIDVEFIPSSEEVEVMTPSQKRVATMKAKDPDAFKKFGKKGGEGSNTGGFSQVEGLAKRAVNKRWENERKKKAGK